MLDLKYIRENPDEAKTRLQYKGNPEDIDNIIELDKSRRAILQEVEQLKQDRNRFSQEVSQRKREGQDATDLINKTREISQKARELDEKLKGVEDSLTGIMEQVPNLPHSSVPVGKDASENVEVKRWGDIPEFDFPVSDHMEICERLDIVDFPRGSKISGRGFPVYKGMGARLERALINFMLDIQTQKHDYREVIPPLLVNRDSMRGTGQIPKLEEDMYLCEKDDLFLIPTAEVPLTNLYRDETLQASDLPMRFCAYTPCFRREAGSWGKDTRGFLRLHQFNKVELVKYVVPETSYDELDALLANALYILETLQIPYRVLELCSGDLSFGAAKCFDIEVWSPAEQKWLEASSCSNFEDFQARRMNFRFKRESGSRPEFVHTLNGSGLATSRLIVALLEVNQQADGSIKIPEALQDYTGFKHIIRTGG